MVTLPPPTTRPAAKDAPIAPPDLQPNRPRSRAEYARQKRSGEPFYPESDGKRMADNMAQADWMTFLCHNLRALYKEDPNVLVPMDLLWYPVRGEPLVNVAPDVMVIFGRPKYRRGSYRQFDEDNVAPQVVFSIISDTNTVTEMMEKTVFYQKYGVQEFYLYDPETGAFEAVLFGNGGANIIPIEYEWISPLLGVRFVPQPCADMEVYFPDGEPFQSLQDTRDMLGFRTRERDWAAERAARESDRAERERDRAERERAARQAAEEASQAAEQARQAADQAREAAEAEIARLRALLAERGAGD